MRWARAAAVVLLAGSGCGGSNGNPVGAGGAGGSGTGGSAGASATGRGGGAGRDVGGAAGSGAGGNAGGGGATAGGGAGGRAGSGTAGSAGTTQTGTAGASGTAGGAGAPQGGKGGAGTGGQGGAAGAAATACTNEGAVVCAGHATNARLRCQGGTLVLNDLCPDGQLCDTSNAACKTVVAGCQGRSPGDAFCDGSSRSVCGPDLVSIQSTTPCASAALCMAGSGSQCGACVTDQYQCTGVTLQGCKSDHTGFQTVAQCTMEPCNAKAGACALSGAPEWEDFNGDDFWWPRFDDPRWTIAPLQFLKALPAGGSTSWIDDVAMRVLADGLIVYVSFEAQTDSDGPTSDDYVDVALSEGTASGGYVFKVSADTSGTVIGAPPAPAQVTADSPPPKELSPIALSEWHTVSTADVSWGAANAVGPAWFTGAVWDRPGQTPRWAITLRFDLSPTGLNIAGETYFFFGAQLHNGSTDEIVANVAPATDTNRVGDSIVPMHATDWLQYCQPGLTGCTNAITVVPND